MSEKFAAVYKIDENGNPVGGDSFFTGSHITWKSGPTCKRPVEGAEVREAIEAIHHFVNWLNTVNDGAHQCQENDETLKHLFKAAAAQARRTHRREQQGVEGTNEPHKSTDGEE